MMERRVEPRMLCADLVDIRWRDQAGRLRRGVANLEDISISGACLQMDRPIALGTVFQISYPNGELTGKIKYCIFREIGYFLGVEFDPGSRWTERQFKPQHLLDPRRLMNQSDSDTAVTPPALH